MTLRFVAEVSMIRDSWVEIIPKENPEIEGYNEMSFKEKALAIIKDYNDKNSDGPQKRLISIVTRSALNDKLEIDESKVYGYCIDDSGFLWKVGLCDHKSVIGGDYNNANEWVLTVNPRKKKTDMSIRLNPNGVSKKALRKTISIVKDFDCSGFNIETILTNPIYENDDLKANNWNFNKRETIKRLSVIDKLDICSLGLRY